MLDRAARDHAARHGWTKSRTVQARQAIRILLGLQDTPGAPVNASEVTALARIGFAVQPVLDILTAAELLHEDRDPPVAAWFARQITGLPAPMISELRIWFDVMHRGSSRAPRRRPRSPVTIRPHLSWAMPALRAWAAGGHQSLREISPAEVIAALPSGGTPRATRGQGLRSLFTVLTGRTVIFTNPMARVRTGRPDIRQPLPLGQLYPRCAPPWARLTRHGPR